MTLSFDEFMREVAAATQREDLLRQSSVHLSNGSLSQLGFDSLEIVVIGSVLLDHLPRGVGIPEVIDESIGDATLGELYHLYAAASERSEG